MIRALSPLPQSSSSQASLVTLPRLIYAIDQEPALCLCRVQGRPKNLRQSSLVRELWIEDELSNKMEFPLDYVIEPREIPIFPILPISS